MDRYSIQCTLSSSDEIDAEFKMLHSAASMNGLYLTILLCYATFTRYRFYLQQNLRSGWRNISSL